MAPCLLDMAGMRLEPPCPIVVMLNTFDLGGTERQTVELVRRLDRRRFRVFVACIQERGSLRSQVPDSVAVRAFPISGFRRLEAWRQAVRFARWCRSVRARLVHTCDLYSNLMGLPAAALARIPMRVGSRRGLLTGDRTAAQLACQRAAYRAAHVIVANSDAARAQLEREGVARTKIQVIPNGIDFAMFAEPRAPRLIRRIVTVANLRPGKGHDTIIDAAPRILATHPDAEFHFAGDGPLRETLGRRADARGVSHRVRFLGHSADVPALLAASDLFVLASRSEAFPNAVMEAMAAGLPVVATDVGGVPELVRQNVTGILVAPGNPDALADEVINLMALPDRAFAIGRAARFEIERNYSFDRMIASFEDLYLNGLGRRRPVLDPAQDLAAS